MYVDFKEEKAKQSGFGNGLLWMLSGVMMGLLVGLAMYYFANRGIPSIETANASQATSSSEKKTTFVKDKKVTSPFGASKNSEDPEEQMVASLIDKNHKEEAKERPSFSYYAVLPDLNVPIQTIRNPTEKEIAAKKEKERQRKLAEEAAKNGSAEDNADNSEAKAETTIAKGETAYMLQVASYKRRKQADSTRGRLKRKGMRSYVEKRKVRGKIWFRVMAGPVESSKLENWKTTMASLGHKPLVFPAK